MPPVCQRQSGMVFRQTSGPRMRCWDPSMIVANAWAKLVGAKFSGTVITIQVPLKQNEPSDKRMRRIFEALMENGSFFENLRAFMDSLM